MPIRIGDGFKRLEIDGRVVATATERASGWWELIYWPRFCGFVLAGRGICALAGVAGP